MIYDLSYANRGVQIKSLPEVDAVILRLGIHDHLDTEFENFIQQVIRCGKPFGLFWFTYAANVNQAREEVSVIKTLLEKQYNKWGAGFNGLWRLPLFIDYEAEQNYDDHIKPSSFNLTAPIFKTMIEAENIPLGLYLNTGLIVQYKSCAAVMKDAEMVIEENLWWADWTTRTECPVSKYVMRQTGAGLFKMTNGRTYKVDTDVKGNSFKLWTPFYKMSSIIPNVGKFEIVNTWTSDDGIYRFTVEKKI